MKPKLSKFALYKKSPKVLRKKIQKTTKNLSFTRTKKKEQKIKNMHSTTLLPKCRTPFLKSSKIKRPPRNREKSKRKKQQECIIKTKSDIKPPVK